MISILVLNYNGKHLLQDCLASILNQNFTDYELVIVDNNSSDGSTAYVKEHFPKAKLVENTENFGFAKGNNIGIKACKGEWIFFLNNDAVLEQNCLEILAEHIEKREPEQLIFAPIMFKFYFPEQVDSAGDALYPWGYACKCNTENKVVTSVCCGAAIFNRELLEKLNGFDEDFFLYYEDVDLSLRARHLGTKICIVPSAKVLHKGSATVGKRNAQSLYYIDRNRFWTKLKNFPFWTLLKYTPHSFICSVSSLLLWTKRGFLGTWLKSRFAMILGIPKMLKKRNIIAKTKEFESWLVSPSINIKSRITPNVEN